MVGTFFLIFGTVFLAELPDKTSLAAMALGSRFQALPVWVGGSLALLAQTVIALVAGRLLGLMPASILKWLEVILFWAFALWMWKRGTEKEPELGNTSNGSVLARAFLLVFVAEFGDLTQVATAVWASRLPHQLILVGAAAALALVLANGISTYSGKQLTRWIGSSWIARGASALFFLIGLAILVQ